MKFPINWHRLEALPRIRYAGTGEVGEMLEDKLARLRKRNGLTQADMAAYLQISRQAYSTYETGKHEMDMRTLCKLAEYFNVSIDYLFGRYDIKPFLIDDEDERELIEAYRALDARGKGSVRAVIKYETSV
jgi:transcriptional regulator with XRE-family HTH domain